MENNEINLNEKFDSVSETVHKECVKVYRNVQAVVVEENKKQAETLETELGQMKKKMGTILGVAVIGWLTALAGIAFQVLVYLQII